MLELHFSHVALKEFQKQAKTNDRIINVIIAVVSNLNMAPTEAAETTNNVTTAKMFVQRKCFLGLK